MHCPICGTQLDDNAKVCWACGHSLDKPGETRFQLDPGTTLQGGRYRLEKVLGQGGFGITYVATDTTLSRQVAVKELFPEGSSRHEGVLYPPTSLAGGGAQSFQDVIDSFLEEARTVARFSLPSIVRVYDVFEENQTAYLVMEYLRGDILTKRIAERGRLDPEEVRSLADDLSGALDIVHGADLLHRDIKPDNIFLTRDGRTVLIDFGSARTFSQNQTVSHTRLVTPGYAPPEQYASQARFGPYTDLYALAATLHHALSGQMPPPATDRMMGTPLPSLPADTPKRLRQALETSLAIRIEERPADVAAFRRLLDTETSHLPRPDAYRDAPGSSTSQRARSPSSSSPKRPNTVTPAPLQRLWSYLFGAPPANPPANPPARSRPRRRGASCGGFAIGCAIPFVLLFVVFALPRFAPLLVVVVVIWGVIRLFSDNRSS